MDDLDSLEVDSLHDFDALDLLGFFIQGHELCVRGISNVVTNVHGDVISLQ